MQVACAALLSALAASRSASYGRVHKASLLLSVTKVVVRENAGRAAGLHRDPVIYNTFYSLSPTKYKFEITYEYLIRGSLS